MTPSPESQDEALRRSALETIRRATEAGVSMDTLVERLRERRHQMEQRTKR